MTLNDLWRQILYYKEVASKLHLKKILSISLIKGWLFYACLSHSGLRWAKKTGIFILGTIKIMTVDQYMLINECAGKNLAKILVFLTHRFLWEANYTCIEGYKARWGHG